MPRIGPALRKIALVLVISAFAAGCNMSGPGVARLGAPQQPGTEHETTYDSSWVNKDKPDAINTLDHDQELSVDISERQVGVRYLDEDSKIGDKYEPAYMKRQREREEARREAWRKRMGLKTIKDEQKERESE
ncbi:MAG: hypothetical protein H6841_04010 [Planctomycetes bacterium]|nr:hypothetical protein [Planctomycetota bacterium]MCB9934541.1 hypothetical protein [Planctomycetota bacterium]